MHSESFVEEGAVAVPVGGELKFSLGASDLKERGRGTHRRGMIQFLFVWLVLALFLQLTFPLGRASLSLSPVSQ